MTNYSEIADKIFTMLVNCAIGEDKRVLEYIAQELQNEGIGWIPVNERVPSSMADDCLVMQNTRNVYVAYYCQDGRWDAMENGFISGITHWQPLPSGPKEAT